MILASHFAESSADYWVYNLGNSQLKRTLFVSAVLLSLFGFSNVFPMQIWDSCLTKNHLSSKFKHCHSLVHSAAVFLSSCLLVIFFHLNLEAGKLVKKESKMMQLKALLGNYTSWEKFVDSLSYTFDSINILNHIVNMTGPLCSLGLSAIKSFFSQLLIEI